jgi:hypothetical protein
VKLPALLGGGGRAGFVLVADGDWDDSKQAVDTADVNGDGIDDLIAGNLGADPDGLRASAGSFRRARTSRAGGPSAPVELFVRT